jgi:hypothetical protein
LDRTSHDRLFNQVAQSGAPIRLAVLDFSPSDTTIMARIASNMPAISTLRLEEVGNGVSILFLPTLPWADAFHFVEYVTAAISMEK